MPKDLGVRYMLENKLIWRDLRTGMGLILNKSLFLLRELLLELGLPVSHSV
jgi:hypothetical protein